MARNPFASLAAAAALMLAPAVGPALAQQAPAPAPGPDTVQPPPVQTPAPAPAAPPVASPAAPAPAQGAVRELRMGARGASVKSLQRALRKRGIRVPVDGAYGARTRAGVRVLQRRMRVKPTGVADSVLLQRLGVKVRAIAGTSPTRPSFSEYPVPEPNDTTPSATGFVWPANGVVSSPFGPRWGRMHEGLDIAAPAGRHVRASKAGIVVTAAAAGAYGNLVVLDHGNGETTRYGHLSAFDVARGQMVAIGQVVGRVGSTGRSTGNHLHFEIRFSGVAVNPLAHL
jgi:murein DD-endopeptidase MepM/ murein hydrolase activator NlpD